MTFFKVHQLLRCVAAKEFSSTLIEVLSETPCNIVAYPGIKRAVSTQDDVNAPIHYISRGTTKTTLTYSGTTSIACGPLGPCSVSNETL